MIIRHHLDVRRLRVKFRIVGGMVGALPLQPRQNCQLGLPLLLMPEEVSVLREEGEWLLVSMEPCGVCPNRGPGSEAVHCTHTFT